MTAVRSDVRIDTRDGIRCYLPASGMNDSDAKEFVGNDRFEQSLGAKSKGRALFDFIVGKSNFIRTFDHVKPTLDIRPGHVVLELGAAHAWASVLIKDDCPGAYVVTSDMVPETVAHSTDYERLVGASVDEKWACSARDLPFADGQFDRVFTFAAFHHFGDHGDYSRALAEVARVLKPGGRLILLYEPNAPAFLYPLAFHRANRRREIDGVDEDVLVAARLRLVAERVGLRFEATPFEFYRYRESVLVGAYYFLLAKLRLGSFVVCTTNMVLEKASAASPRPAE